MTGTQPILVTGGAGFIGSNFVLDWLQSEGTPVVNLDALTYAGNLANLHAVRSDSRHVFVQGDIKDGRLVRQLLQTHRPRAIVHFAAETHVDRSVLGPEAFLETNITGTYTLLTATREHLEALPRAERAEFRFLHVSTDEVYGTLGPDDPPFSESTPYAPNSPYAASKAASDMLVRAWHHTYSLPTLITNCSNNYGPFQFPEKLIPLVTAQALEGRPLPIYGDGKQVRDWLYVQDHTAAIRRVLRDGRLGETYNIGGNNQKTNLEVVHELCALLDEFAPDSLHKPHAQLIRFVTDRPGHDRRYAINARKITTELGWAPAHSFETGLRSTVAWYLKNQAWVKEIQSGAYKQWMDLNYAARESAAAPIETAGLSATDGGQ